MTRSEAAEHALRAVELEREAVKHCSGLDNPTYLKLMEQSRIQQSIAERFVESAKQDRGRQ